MTGVGVDASGVGVGCGSDVGVGSGALVGSGLGVCVGSGVLVGVGVTHSFFGPVPLRKYSSSAEVLAVSLFRSSVRQSLIFLILAGGVKESRGLPIRNRSINCLQIGAAPNDPAIESIGALSLLPTHTPTTRLGVYPMVSAS